MNNIIEIPQIIPQLYGVYDTWNYFIHKASHGSYKADEILLCAKDAFVDITTGIQGACEMEKHKNVLKDQFEQKPPYKNKELLIKMLLSAAKLNPKEKILPKPIHQREYYQSLWQKGRVDSYELIHDASLNAFNKWSYKEYMNLDDLSYEHFDDYNSLDLVTQMILLISTFIKSCPNAFNTDNYEY